MEIGGATGTSRDSRMNGRILYREDNFYHGKELTISENPHNVDEQYLVLKTEREDLVLYLPSGTLEDLAKSGAQGLSQKICDMDNIFLTLLSHKSIPIETVGWALAKAYINYSEQFNERVTTPQKPL